MNTDDLGDACPIDRPRRIVSLVPSLTESVAVTAPELLVGVTDWCTHPPGLDRPRVGGTRYPDVTRVLALRPDLVLANAEENRREDVEALRAAGVAVWVTYPRTVDAALDSLGRMFEALRLDRPEWLAAAAAAWSAAPRLSRQAVVPIWRRPWMVLGSDTFAGDVLARLGVRNLYDDATERYPRTTPEEALARRPDLIVLPDEPYRFTADDGSEAFGGVPYALVSGRHLTWYGPSLAEAPEVLAGQLSNAR